MMNDMRDLRSRQAALASEVRRCVPAAWWGADGGDKTQLGDRFKLSQVCLATERNEHPLVCLWKAMRCNMSCACSVAWCRSSSPPAQVMPCCSLTCHSHYTSNKQLCRLQMDLERRYAAVLHKVVRRINGKLAVVLQHLLAVQQRNEEDGPTLPQRLAPVLDMYTYVCGCKAPCMDALLQHLPPMWSMSAGISRQHHCGW